ncbi:unnamed protein product [Phytophthora lilii]|uniref:Unnamed protein product n=1 Tax=Phytophthora lilii TaxID=2077276 RepID=A0A9W6X1Q1_9STRA|nr:unnamed protein product [Phytophthora lilii]
MQAGVTNNASTPAEMVPAVDCDDILEAFLHDMSALDQGQLRRASETEQSAPEPSPKKRELTQVFQGRKMSTTAASSKKKRLNPSWLKRKRELEALREQTQALETRVEFLKMKKTSGENSEGDEAEMIQHQEKQKQALAAEKQRCQAAQNENEYLKERLQAYVNLSGSLQTVLTAAEQHKKQILAMSMAAARSLRFANRAGYRLRLASSSVFDMLEERVNSRFLKLEASLGEKLHMTSPDTELIQVYDTTNDRRQGIVELRRTQLLPFEESAISSTIWSVIKLSGFPDGQDSRVVKRSEDVYAMDSRLTVCLDDGGTMNLNTHSVMKRFATPDGIVFLLESISDWTADLEDSGSWVHSTDEGGCFMINSYSLDGTRRASVVAPGISQLRSQMTLKPGDNSQSTTCYPLAEPRIVHEVVIPSFREIVQSRHQFVENALFDCIRGNDALNVSA